jgi:hypothetical protein
MLKLSSACWYQIVHVNSGEKDHFFFLDLEIKIYMSWLLSKIIIMVVFDNFVPVVPRVRKAIERPKETQDLFSRQTEFR